MRTVFTERVIDAPPATVWAVLTDLGAYPEWNPHLTAADVALHEGATGEITVRPGRGRSRTLPVTVTESVPEERLAWTASIGGGRLFRGRHTFLLVPEGPRRTRFVNTESLSGVVPRLLLRGDLRPAYEAMNEALAERAEGMLHPDSAPA